MVYLAYVGPKKVELFDADVLKKQCEKCHVFAECEQIEDYCVFELIAKIQEEKDEG